MKKSFISQFADLFFGSALGLVLGVVTTPLITRLVSPSVYGQFSLFNTYAMLAMSVLTLGLDQALCRYFFAKDDLQYKKGFFQFSLLLATSIAFICAIIAIVVFRVSEWDFGFDFKYLMSLIVVILLMLIYRFSTMLIRLSYKTKLYSSLNILKRATYIIFALLFLLKSQIDALYALIFATLISELICLVIAIIPEKKYYKLSIESIKNLGQTVKHSRIIKFGLPLIVATGVMHIFQATDKLCVNYFGSYTDVGIYAGAQNIISIFAIIQTSFNTLWAPKAVEHFEKDRNDTSFFVKMNAYITVAMFIFGATVLLFKDIIILFLGEEYRSATYIFPFLMFNPIMYTISETTVQGITFFEKTQKQVYIVIASAVLNLLLNLILIPVLGPKGAAVSTGLSYILFFTLRTLISNHYYKVHYPLRNCYLLVVCFMALCTYSMYHSFNFLFVLFYAAFLIVLYFLYKPYIHELISILHKKFGKFRFR